MHSPTLDWTYHVLDHIGQARHEHIHCLESLITDQSTVSSNRILITHCSLSTMANAIFGITFPARSSLSKISTVAIIAINPATRAWTKGSFRLLANAGTRTFFFVFGPSIGASRPSRIQVFVRIEGSASVCILANSLKRSLLRVRSLSLGARGKMALTVASRMTGTVSANPVI